MTINPPPFDGVTAFGIGALAWLVAGVFVWLFGRGQRSWTIRLATGVLLVFAASAAAVTSGWLQRTDTLPPPMALLIASVFAAAFALGLSRFGRSCADSVPLRSLVAFQIFRLPLELLMHRAAELGIMPVELSYSGYNFDIVTGAAALVLTGAMAGGRTLPRGILWAWNLWGCLCLAVITFVAIAGSPMIRLFGEGPHLNTWVLFLPYVWVPIILVTAALFGHIVLTRALLSGRTR